MSFYWADGNGGRKKIGEDYTLPTASEVTKGGVKVGDGLYMDGETLQLDPNRSFAGVLEDFPKLPQEGCMVIIDDTPYLFDGENWRAFNDYDDFTGATELQGGASGLVPAPAAGQHNEVLRGDGSWGKYLLGTESSTLEGAMWLSVIDGGD